MAQNMVAAHRLGLASCPVTFHDADRVRELLGIPDDHEAPMGVGLGRSARGTAGVVTADPLDELVDWGRWKD